MIDLTRSFSRFTFAAVINLLAFSPTIYLPLSVMAATPVAPTLFSGDLRYRLGPGDRVRMSVFKIPGYEGLAEVIADGTASFPRIGSIFVAGLTLDQARDRISKAYSRFLRRPIVSLDLVAARPMRITVTGEVQRPGLYSLDRSGNYQLDNAGDVAGSAGSTTIQSSGWPTMVEAIQKAGGITARGDLRAVILRRQFGPGSQRELRVNFWEALRDGRQIENPILFDGDVVMVTPADDLSYPDLIKIGASTFAPDTIGVNVVGEVMRPGVVKIRANSHLSNAVLSAGGFVKERASVSNVQLLRLEPNGTITQKQVRFNPSDPLGSDNNPALQDGDVIVVNRNRRSAFNDAVRATLEPVGPVINAASLLRLLGVN
ncbi:SLBB domain-containing protein [Synechococcus sp. BA-124 BA4]|uniref:SLBB domain-containing protein n=1 Tax=Synechococcus sp. BA-124 BA4 TaxID=3110251 RepID=UPI002B20760C|nr:SLBB domain-containing protein [Synechococcus sp. BA-124 BA4]MEA5400720.1 SLBB domain-containing protein [Synechococcus sp. BA-124 BA4]MEA5411758.1 SLBB domain-containing protein [Synechococcus sp. BA-120 BA3]